MASIKDKDLRENLQQHVQAQALLLSLKHVFDDNLQEIMETILISSFQFLDKTGHRDDVADMLYYLYNEGNLSDSTQFWAFLHRKFSHDVEEKVMTLGQQAVQQAVQQTKEQESEEMAFRMLDKNLTIDLISEITQLPLEKIKELAKKHH